MTDHEAILAEVHKELAANKRALDAAELAAACLAGVSNEFATAGGFAFTVDSVIDWLGGNDAQHRRVSAAEAQLRDAQQAIADLNRALGQSRFDVTLAAVRSVPGDALARDDGRQRKDDPTDMRPDADAVVRWAAEAASRSSRVVLADVEAVRDELVRRRQVLESALAGVERNPQTG